MRRLRASSSLPLEIEADTLGQVADALELGVERILLDNMSPADVTRAVELVARRSQLEVSGGVTLANVRAYAETGVDAISIGALTHSAASLDVSLEVERGETRGLVGESGSGKTTLARCITGLLAADSGKLLFEDRVLAATTARRSRVLLRAIQMVFQNPDSTLNPAWSTRSILNRAVHKLSGLDRRAERDRVDHLATSVGVEPRFLQQKPAELSGGQRQRVAIARAFAGSPSLVVCDEPASALDVSVQVNILNLLAELQATQGVSYIFISHDLAVVRYLADHIAVMYLGKIVELGRATEVIDRPRHPYTRALISAIPRPDPDAERDRRRTVLTGDPPTPLHPPAGCAFHPRCPFVQERCRLAVPPLERLADGREAACVRIEEIA